MFYTQYRPQRFSELVGLDKVAQAILSQLAKGAIPHALFFCGPRGTGKTTTARLVAKALNCAKPGRDSEPCGKCPSCKAVAAGRFLDLIEIDAASNRGIDDIRDLREKIKLLPTEAKYKVYIIDEVHMLTTEAFNALLKTLEEPPKHAVFILCTTDPQKVPATIKSRCQRFEFKRASVASVVQKLETIVADQQVAVAKEDLKLIAAASQGGFRDAETLLEEVIRGGISAREAIGLSAEAKVVELVELLASNDRVAAIKLINGVYESGADLAVWTRELLEYLRKMMLVEAGVGAELVDATKEEYEAISSQISKGSEFSATLPASGELYSQKLVEIFTKAYEQLKAAAVPQLPLEVAVVKVSSFCFTTVTPDKTPRRDPEKSIDSSLVAKKWDDILVKIKPYNHSLEAVLRSCFVVTGNKDQTEKLIIGVPFKFHLEKLNDARNYQIIKKVISEVVGREVDYDCQIAKKEVTAADRLQAVSKKAKATFNGEVVV